MADTAFQADAFQTDAFQIEEAVVEPPAPPPVLGGGGGGAISSGRWVQVGDRSRVFVDFADARARARTTAFAVTTRDPIEFVPAHAKARTAQLATITHIIPLRSTRATARTAPLDHIPTNDSLELLQVLDLVSQLERKRRRA